MAYETDLGSAEYKKIGVDLAIQHVEAQKAVWKNTGIPPEHLLDMLIKNLQALKQWVK